MKRTAVLLALVLGTACNKDAPASSSPTADPDSAAASTEPDVPQEPDPPEIVQGAQLFVTGNYEAVIELLTPVYADLEQRKQYRAGGLAAGWLAISHAQLVFENAEEPAAHAQAMAEKTADPEVVAVAKLARGGYLLGNQDYDASVQAFEGAASAAPGSMAGALANVFRGETLINRAFGRGEDGKLERPQDLETAKQAYAEAAKGATSSDHSDALVGRVEEGLAAIAKFQGKKSDACKHAQAALDLYKNAGVSNLLQQGPENFVVDEKCDRAATAGK
jgi:tetratricopeptide (TPR) repeat protein